LKGLPSGYNRDFHEDKEILVEGLTLANRAAEVHYWLLVAVTHPI
jgi:argininosuccinate lyase